MRYLLNKLLLFLCSFVLILTNQCDENSAIVSFLIGIILSGIYIIPLDKYKFLEPVLEIVFILVVCSSFRYEAVLYILPMITYDLFLFRFKLSGIAVLLMLALNAYDNPLTIFFIAILCLIAITFAYDFTVISNYNSKLHNIQDISTERELFMAESNRQLIINQDTEITNATLKERNRIAREIHDNVGHLLTRSILQVGVVKILNKDEKLSTPLEELHETLNTAMTSMRNSVHDLYDESVDLKSSIEKIVEGTNATESMKCMLSYDCSEIVSKEIKYAFISITKEAVNNSLKYSNGDTIKIDLQEHPGFYRLSIEDNGKPDPDFSKNTYGIGMINIKDRIDALGGTLRVISDNGFKIIATVMKEDL